MQGIAEVVQTKKTLHNMSLDLIENLERNIAANTLEGVANRGYGVTLEKRQRGGKYFYTAVRRNGRVVKKYLGKTDAFGSAIAGMTTLNRCDQRSLREKKRDHWANVREQTRQDFQILDDFLARSYDAFASGMQSAGYHRPGRGPWRKKRQGREVLGMNGLVQTSGINRDRKAEAWMNSQIVNEAANNRGNDELRTRAIEILRDPKCIIGTKLVNDMSGVLARFAGNNPVVKEIYMNQARTLWREMTGTFANTAEADRVPVLERILIERIIACRFALGNAETKRAEANTYKAAEFAERNIDRAQRRLLAAVKTLAEVKRLGVPQVNVAMAGAVQLNVGEKQVNATLV